MCSHPRTGDATDEKIAEKKSREIQRVEFFATKSRIFAARWRRDNFQKIASPSQAKNRSRSRGLIAQVIIEKCVH